MRWQPAQPAHANNKAVELQISTKTDLLTMSPFWVKWRNMQQKFVETTDCLMTIIHCLVWQKNIRFFCTLPLPSQKLVSGTPHNHGSLEHGVPADQLWLNPTDVRNSKLSAGWGHKWLTMQHSGTEEWNKATIVLTHEHHNFQHVAMMCQKDLGKESFKRLMWMPIHCVISCQASQSRAFYISWIRHQFMDAQGNNRRLPVDLSLLLLTRQFNKSSTSDQCFAGLEHPCSERHFFSVTPNPSWRVAAFPIPGSRSDMMRFHTTLCKRLSLPVLFSSATSLATVTRRMFSANMGDAGMAGWWQNPFSFMKGTLPKSGKRMTGRLTRSLPLRQRHKHLMLVLWINSKSCVFWDDTGIHS